MLIYKLSGIKIECNKCGWTIRSNINLMSKTNRVKLENKKKYCGSCIIKRIRRDRICKLLNHI